MHRRLAHLAFTLMVLVPLVAFASSPAPTPRAATCTVWTWTNYFSDEAKTNRVGYCSVTCYQARYGIADPTFTGGGVCSGTSGPYTTKLYTACPGLCPNAGKDLRLERFFQRLAPLFVVAPLHRGTSRRSVAKAPAAGSRRGAGEARRPRAA